MIVPLSLDSLWDSLDVVVGLGQPAVTDKSKIVPANSANESSIADMEGH